jgi:hypothetical protein
MTPSNRPHLPNLLGFLGPLHCPPPPSTSSRPLPTAPPVSLSILQLNPLHCSRLSASTHPQPNLFHRPHRLDHRLWHSIPSTPFARTLICHKVPRNAYLSLCQRLSVNESRICHPGGYVMLPAGPLRLPETTHLWIVIFVIIFIIIISRRLGSRHDPSFVFAKRLPATRRPHRRGNRGTHHAVLPHRTWRAAKARGCSAASLDRAWLSVDLLEFGRPLLGGDS